MDSRIDKLKAPKGEPTELFLSSPIEFLCYQVVEELKKTPQWVELFGAKFINPYKRMDYGMSNLPALRIYNNRATRLYESWFLDGDLVFDIIFPASLRRTQLQQYSDTVSSAMLQQVSRQNFFQAVEANVPGLNELGKRFDIDKSLAFEIDEDLVPLTQINVNFRLDLRIWYPFMESDDRTREDPFERTLADLKRVVSKIQGLKDDGEVSVELTASQKPGEATE